MYTQSWSDTGRYDYQTELQINVPYDKLIEYLGSAVKQCTLYNESAIERSIGTGERFQ